MALAMFLVVSTAVFLPASFMASAAIWPNCCVSDPHHCIGSINPAFPAGAAALFFGADFLAGALPKAEFTAPATVSVALSLKALATSPMLKFMPLSVASVIFWTSSAVIVACRALAF